MTSVIARIITGDTIDLLNPVLPESLTLTQVGTVLARKARFAGQTPGRMYSVAEHCLRGAESLHASDAERVRQLCVKLWLPLRPSL